MLFQFTGMSNSNKDAVSASPDYSVDRARETTILFLPGPAPSYLLFIVFGTTAPFRKYMYATFVPKRWQMQRIPDVRERITTSILSPKSSSISTSRSRSMALSTPAGTQQHLFVELVELERGRNPPPSNDSDDTLLMLPLMKPTYHRIQSSRMRG